MIMNVEHQYSFNFQYNHVNFFHNSILIRVSIKFSIHIWFKIEYWVTIYESHDSDLIIFAILFANSNDNL